MSLRPRDDSVRAWQAMRYLRQRHREYARKLLVVMDRFTPCGN